MIDPVALSGTDADGPFSEGAELANKLASSATARQCAVLNAARWAFDRPEIDDRLRDLTLAFPRMPATEPLAHALQGGTFQFQGTRHPAASSADLTSLSASTELAEAQNSS